MNKKKNKNNKTMIYKLKIIKNNNLNNKTY